MMCMRSIACNFLTIYNSLVFFIIPVDRWLGENIKSFGKQINKSRTGTQTQQLGRDTLRQCQRGAFLHLLTLSVFVISLTLSIEICQSNRLLLLFLLTF